MPYEFPRCQVVPLANHEVAFILDGVERLRWHSGSQYPRPFFFPLIGPGGHALTRMGHPGAPNHDHHRSIWFAHEKVSGVNFWADTSPARIRQKEWIAYQDGNDEAIMAVKLGWFDGHDPKELMEQELIVAVRPGPDGETFLELQATFKPTAEMLELGKTNFGFLAVRVAKSISAYFGGGQLTNSDGGVGEPALFGKSAAWVDYSGPMPTAWGGAGITPSATSHIEGITYFDHPSNPGHPNGWHVREDGWMGCSPCMREEIVLKRATPLTLRYLLHAHRGAANAERTAGILADFGQRAAFRIVRPKVPHTSWSIERTG